MRHRLNPYKVATDITCHPRKKPDSAAPKPAQNVKLTPRQTIDSLKQDLSHQIFIHRTNDNEIWKKMESAWHQVRGELIHRNAPSADPDVDWHVAERRLALEIKRRLTLAALLHHKR